MLAGLTGEPDVGESVSYPDGGWDDYAHLDGEEADEVAQYPDHMYWDERCDEDWYDADDSAHLAWGEWEDEEWYDACDDEGDAAAGHSMGLLGLCGDRPSRRCEYFQSVLSGDLADSRHAPGNPTRPEDILSDPRHADPGSVRPGDMAYDLQGVRESSSMAQAASASVDGKPLVDPPEFSDRIRDTDKEPYWIPGAFPTIFQNETGDPHNYVLKEPDLTTWGPHIMRSRGWVAQAHMTFMYWWMNMVQRIKVLSAKNWFVRDNPNSTGYTVEDLKSMSVKTWSGRW